MSAREYTTVLQIYLYCIIHRPRDDLRHAAFNADVVEQINARVALIMQHAVE